MNKLVSSLWAACVLLIAAPALAQYSPAAGQNAPTVRSVEQRRDERSGKMVDHVVQKEAAKDGFGNAQGNQFDLAVDGAFEGETVAVIQLYQFSFDLPKAALKEKGFSVYRWNGAPKPEELEAALKKSSQLWIIADSSRHLNDKHLAIIKKFFDAGHGVYIWGDNEPYYADANAVGEALVGVTMRGDLHGDQTVGLQKEPGKAGVLRRHLLTTGLEYIYEGITIATIDSNQKLTPLIYGSANNLVAAFYDRDGKRLIFDGGFTRLYNKWDTAGTGRYVKNAAAWLANVERFPTPHAAAEKKEGAGTGGAR
jgi:hypothetical protein